MSDREELYKAVIGPSKQDYYLRQFAKFDEAGKAGVSWNWPAALFNFFWFMYRRMGLFALGYLVLANVLTFIFTMLLGDAGNLLALVAQIALPGMFGNALYHRRCNNKIATAQAAGGDMPAQLARLGSKGGTSNAGVFALVALLFVAIIGILAAIAIPQYQTYTNKARLADAVNLGRQAAESVEAYRRQNQRLPGTLGEAGFVTSLPTFVQGVEINDHMVVVTLRQDGSFPNGGSLTWEPIATDAAAPAWKCTGRGIPAELLPGECR